MRYQLRTYHIAPGRLDEFLPVFEEALEIRRSVGFEVVGKWADREGSMIVWIAGYDGPDSFEEASDRYQESPLRQQLDPDPRTFIDSIETRMLEGL